MRRPFDADNILNGASRWPRGVITILRLCVKTFFFFFFFFETNSLVICRLRFYILAYYNSPGYQASDAFILNGIIFG